MIRPHILPAEMVDDLALGLGGPAAIDALWRGQRSRRLLLIRLVVDRLGRMPGTTAAVNAIVEAERQDPRSRDVLIEPLVGAWAAATVRATHDSSPTPQQVGHLGAIAAVAALRAGTNAELSARAVGGWLYLPSLGRIPVAAPDGEVALSLEGGRLSIDGVPIEPAGPRWQSRRSLRAGDLTVAFDDLDPYRDAYHVPAAERLTADETAEWAQWLDDAWRILTTFVPERAAEIATGLHSLVPLERRQKDAAHSATAREAVGVIGLDLPNSVADFAVALVHEFQHSKLSALLDILPLYDGSSQKTFFAPWRRDPRPIGGLFQGVYAFLAVADTWRALSGDPISFPQAEREFADARLQVSTALGTLSDSGLLTADGRRFVSGMHKCLQQLATTTVSAQSERHAQRVLAQLRARWASLSVG
jgi:uncharacterized protein